MRATSGACSAPDPDPLPPNWRHLPIGYHGRRHRRPQRHADPRPQGQRGPGDFGPTQKLDVELELGFVIGRPSRLGEPVPVERALDHVFGAVLAQRLERPRHPGLGVPPLGPFLASRSRRRSATGSPRSPSSRAPPRAAGARRRCPTCARRRGRSTSRSSSSSTGVVAPPTRAELYWSVAQQIAHLTVNGAALRTGDLLGSGTISGPEKDQRGCLLELSWNGAEPIELADGSTRTFLEDGDEVVLRGTGLGEVCGRVSGR